MKDWEIEDKKTNWNVKGGGACRNLSRVVNFRNPCKNPAKLVDLRNFLMSFGPLCFKKLSTNLQRQLRKNQIKSRKMK